jgi:hypothetical protein
VPHDVSRMIRDPRVETLTSGARADRQLSGRELASLAALEDALPFPAAAPAVAYVASVAYARVPGRGPRDIPAGNRIVRVLGRLGEAGARRLLVLRDTVAYGHARRTIDSAERLQEAGGRTSRRARGRVRRSRARRGPQGLCPSRLAPRSASPATCGGCRRSGVTTPGANRRGGRAGKLSEELDALEDVRRRLRGHVTALRHRLERAMIAGESWTAEVWHDNHTYHPDQCPCCRAVP